MYVSIVKEACVNSNAIIYKLYTYFTYQALVTYASGINSKRELLMLSIRISNLLWNVMKPVYLNHEDFLYPFC